MKNLLLSCALLLLATLGFAQPKLLWQNCYGSNSIERFYFAKPTLDRGYIVSANAGSVGGDVTASIHGQQDAWIMKTDSNGVPQWDRALGGTGGDNPACILQTPDSCYLILISSNSVDGDMTVGKHGNYDCWLAKLSVTGNLLWMRSYGGSNMDGGARIVPTTDGNYIIAGYSMSNDGDVSSPKGGSDAWIIKISPAGNIIWEHSYGSTGGELAMNIAATTDGGFIFCGTHNTTVNGDVTATHGLQDMWIVKIDSLGNLMWEKTVGGTKEEGVSAIIPTFDGNYAAIGWTSSNDVDVTGYHDSTDVFVAKLSPTGALLWAKAYGTIHPEIGWFTSAQQTRDSNLLILAENNLQAPPNYGSRGLWLAVIDQHGNLTSDLTLGGSRDDMPSSLQTVTDSTYIISATTSSDDGDASGGGLHVGPLIRDDGWLLKLKLPVTLSVETPPSASAFVKVYPTLVTSSVNIVFDASATKKRVTLVNSLGQVVADHPRIDSERISIPFSSLAAGTYFLKVMTGEQVTTHKIIYQP